MHRGRLEFNPWIGKIPWGRKSLPPPVFLPVKSHGQRSWQAAVHGLQIVRHDLATKQEQEFIGTPRHSNNASLLRNTSGDGQSQTAGGLRSSLLLTSGHNVNFLLCFHFFPAPDSGASTPEIFPFVANHRNAYLLN